MRSRHHPTQRHIADSNIAFVTVEVLNTSYLGNALLMSVETWISLPHHISPLQFPRGPCQVLQLVIGFRLLCDARPPFRRQGTCAMVVRDVQSVSICVRYPIDAKM